MESAKIDNSFTEKDYYTLPDDMRAELIDGKFYDMASPNRIHQEIISFFIKKIGNYIDSEKGSCKIYPAPFAVKLFNDRRTIVEPDISLRPRQAHGQRLFRRAGLDRGSCIAEQCCPRLCSQTEPVCQGRCSGILDRQSAGKGSRRVLL